jgi:hypothetical protein
LMIFRSTAMWKFIISPAFFCSRPVGVSAVSRAPAKRRISTKT